MQLYHFMRFHVYFFGAVDVVFLWNGVLSCSILALFKPLPYALVHWHVSGSLGHKTGYSQSFDARPLKGLRAKCQKTAKQR